MFSPSRSSLLFPIVQTCWPRAQSERPPAGVFPHVLAPSWHASRPQTPHTRTIMSPAGPSPPPARPRACASMWARAAARAPACVFVRVSGNNLCVLAYILAASWRDGPGGSGCTAPARAGPARRRWRMLCRRRAQGRGLAASRRSNWSECKRVRECAARTRGRWLVIVGARVHAAAEQAVQRSSWEAH